MPDSLETRLRALTEDDIRAALKDSYVPDVDPACVREAIMAVLDTICGPDDGDGMVIIGRLSNDSPR